MKAIKIVTLYISSALFLTGFSSCELTSVTDIEPVYQVSEDKVITNLNQAQNVLYGVYGILKSGLDFNVYIPATASLRGLTMKPGTSAGSSELAFFNNEVTSDNFYLKSSYTKMYYLINNANHVIEKTELLDTDDVRKKQIIAEAKTLRALANFYMLRMWGEFYKSDSEYGIVLKTQPITDATIQPRNTVAETYALILSDLDYGILNGPEFSNTFFVSNLFAKALKSKVLLYKKDYALAAQLALEVMGTDKRSLETTFAEIFSKKIINTKEVLFQLPFDNVNDRNNKAFMLRSAFLPSDYYVAFMQTDARKTATIAYSGVNPRNAKFNGSTYNGVPLTADTEYFLRLDEVYLIYAEAVLRANDDITKAKNTLNIIRGRSNNTLNSNTDKASLLESIRKEKIYELGAESGEEWYDLVRFHTNGDLNINTHKTISSDSKLILPLPEQTIRLSNNIVKQNPNY